MFMLFEFLLQSLLWEQQYLRRTRSGDAGLKASALRCGCQQRQFSKHSIFKLQPNKRNSFSGSGTEIYPAAASGQLQQPRSHENLKLHHMIASLFVFFFVSRKKSICVI